MDPVIFVNQKNQVKSDKVSLTEDKNQSKCVNGSNFSPEGDGGVLTADLNRWCGGRNRCDFAKSAKFGKCRKYGRIYFQEQGNSYIDRVRLKNQQEEYSK